MRRAFKILAQICKCNVSGSISDIYLLNHGQMHKMQFFIYFIVINNILEDAVFWSDSSLNSIIGIPYQSLVFTKQIIGCYPLSKNKKITPYKAWIIIFDGFSCLFPLYFWCFREGHWVDILQGLILLTRH